jgi:hypothetical protein
MCGSDREKHPLMTPDGSARAGTCVICKLLDERDRLFRSLESAGELLVEGKAVQAHRCIELAIRDGVMPLASPAEKETNG